MPRFVCGETIVYSHSFKSISNLCCANRYCANIAAIRPSQSLNEMFKWKFRRWKKKKKKKFEYFLSSCHKSFQSFSIKIKRETIRTLIFFPLNLKIKNNILLCLSEIKFTLHDWKHTRFCKRRRNNYKRKFIIQEIFIFIYKKIFT